VTGLINDLYALAVTENDYATQVLLHWFIEEQVEEEASASQIVDTLRVAGDSGNALIMLDRALGSRGS
jgi:ferritin